MPESNAWTTARVVKIVQMDAKIVQLISEVKFAKVKFQFLSSATLCGEPKRVLVKKTKRKNGTNVYLPVKTSSAKMTVMKNILMI